MRKVLQCEAWSLSDGNHRWFKRITRKKKSVIRDINNNNNNNNNNTENGHIGHCTHTAESAHVEIQWSQRRS
jgi:hypothetical protein